MNSDNVFSAKNLKTIVFVAILVTAITFGASFLQPVKYKSSAKLLVVFNQKNMDVYTASQTANYIANVLSEVVYSDSFIDQVYKNDFSLKDNLGIDSEKRMRNWKKAVNVQIQENKGIMIIDTYDPDAKQANLLAQSISYTIVTKHTLYHGSGDQVEIKMIGSPTVSDKWAQPQILRNTLIGLVAGLILGFTFVVIFPEQRVLAFLGGRRARGRQDETIDLIQEEIENASEKIEETKELIDSIDSNLDHIKK
ncbi:MAG: Wzz/FepE/Etk N-terminal domain-containing protein [Patescibacteria group bacterium]